MRTNKQEAMMMPLLLNFIEELIPIKELPNIIAVTSNICWPAHSRIILRPKRVINDDDLTGLELNFLDRLKVKREVMIAIIK